jgi:hypothetical protein
MGLSWVGIPLLGSGLRSVDLCLDGWGSSWPPFVVSLFVVRFLSLCPSSYFFSSVHPLKIQVYSGFDGFPFLHSLGFNDFGAKFRVFEFGARGLDYLFP